MNDTIINWADKTSTLKTPQGVITVPSEMLKENYYRLSGYTNDNGRYYDIQECYNGHWITVGNGGLDKKTALKEIDRRQYYRIANSKLDNNIKLALLRLLK